MTRSSVLCLLCFVFAMSTSLGWGQVGEKNYAQISQHNLKLIGLAFIQYQQDNDERLPPMESVVLARKALMPYVKSFRGFINPRTQKPYLMNKSISRRFLGSFTTSTVVACYESEPAPDKTRGVVFVDGEAKRIPEAQWPALWAASQNPPVVPPRVDTPGSG